MKTKKTKKCVKCNETKPISEFYHTKKYKDKKSIWCKKCIDKITIEPHYNRRNENTTNIIHHLIIRNVEHTELVFHRLASGDLFFKLDKVMVNVLKEIEDDFIKKFILRWNEFKEIERKDKDV